MSKYLPVLTVILVAILAACGDATETPAATDAERELTLARAADSLAPFPRGDTALLTVQAVAEESPAEPSASVRSERVTVAEDPPPPPPLHEYPRDTLTTAVGSDEGAMLLAATTQQPVPTISTGAIISLIGRTPVCTNAARAGDRIATTVDAEVTGRDGAVIPAGASIVLEIASIDEGVPSFAPLYLRSGSDRYDVTGTVTTRQLEMVKPKTKSRATKGALAGAVLGAVVGQVAGQDARSTVIGAAAGAATGAGAGAITAGSTTCLKIGARLTLELTRPLQLTGTF